MEIITHKLFNAHLTGFFAGTLFAIENGLNADKDGSFKKASATNFRRFYKLLSEEEKKTLHEQLAELNLNPKKFVSEYLEFAKDLTDNFL